MAGLPREQGRSIAIALALAPAVIGCSSPLVGGAPQRAERASGRPPSAVRVVRPEPVRTDEVYAASLYAERDVVVTPLRTGAVERVLVDRGDRVIKGQALVVLETNLAARELEIAEQDLRLAEADFERKQALFGQNIVSQHDFLIAEITKGQARSKLELARGWLERCTVRAAFDGVIVERWVVVGQRVQEDSGTPLFRIVAREPHRARIDVPEERLAGLTAGTQADVWMLNEDEPFSGRVVFVSPAIDPASGTAAVIVQMDRNDEASRLGAMVHVRFNGMPVKSSAPLSIPRDALPGSSVWEGQTTSVFVLADGRAQAREVTVVSSDGGSILVTGELREEDRVIVGAGGLASGDPVTVTEASKSAASLSMVARHTGAASANGVKR